MSAAGIASGPFFGPSSNKPIDITMFDLARVANGQIVEHRGVPDRVALLAQTRGARPAGALKA